MFKKKKLQGLYDESSSFSAVKSEGIVWAFTDGEMCVYNQSELPLVDDIS